MTWSQPDPATKAKAMGKNPMVGGAPTKSVQVRATPESGRADDRTLSKLGVQ